MQDRRQEIIFGGRTRWGNDSESKTSLDDVNNTESYGLHFGVISEKGSQFLRRIYENGPCEEGRVITKIENVKENSRFVSALCSLPLPFSLSLSLSLSVPLSLYDTLFFFV